MPGFCSSVKYYLIAFNKILKITYFGYELYIGFKGIKCSYNWIALADFNYGIMKLFWFLSCIIVIMYCNNFDIY